MEIISVDDLVPASSAKIKVVGVGGGGGNAVQNMIAYGLRGVSFVTANTDVQALNKTQAEQKIQLGEKLTKGLGAGAMPSVGRDAALESVSVIREALEGADMVFVTAGMGGGTGTGAAPIIAQVAKEMGALTVGVVTKPFCFEGAKRRRIAEEGLLEFKGYVDCLITIPNDRLMAFAPKKASFTEMLKKANDVLYFAVKGISDVIMENGLINLDFADVRTIMKDSGLALMGTGTAIGENRAKEAAQQAIMSPLLEDVSLEGATSVLYNISASVDIATDEICEIGTIIYESVHPDANIIFGVVFDESLGEELRVTVIATGIESVDEPVAIPATPASAITSFRQPSAAAIVPAQGLRRQPQPAQNLHEFTKQSSRKGQVESWYDGKSELPPYVRKREALATSLKKNHAPGEDDYTYDDEDFEMPAFIRRQAD